MFGVTSRKIFKRINLERILYTYLIILTILIIFIYIKLKSTINIQIADIANKVANEITLDSQHYQTLKNIISKGNMLSDNFPIGSICILASNSIPTSYLACDGSKYLISEYPDLFVVIGSTFNQNGIDATLYFNVPDLRGRFVKGLDTNHSLGQFEKYATALPTLPFLTDSQGLHTHTTDSQGSHSHDIRIG